MVAMFKNYFFNILYLSTFLSISVAVADQVENSTATVSGGDQIVVSPMNILLDLSESGYANALVLGEDGNPVEGKEIQIVPQDETKIAIESDSLITNKSGYVHFTIIGKREGDTVVSVTDGVISTHINITIRNLIHYVLPYFYGDMQLNLINPSENINYVKIQFHENGDREIPPAIIRLEGKEMKSLRLSEEIGITLGVGWVEVSSAEIIYGGIWTNKGYLPLSKLDE